LVGRCRGNNILKASGVNIDETHMGGGRRI
jgi:hypothetical protein